MDLSTVLENVTKIGLDTAPVIYFVEAHPRYDALVSEIFQRLDRGELVGITSVITMTEVLTQPIRRNTPTLQKEYRDLLLHSKHFELVMLDSTLAEYAAHLRARYNLRTPDALQLSTALSEGCQAFLTNDHQLRRVTELTIIILDDLIEDSINQSS